MAFDHQQDVSMVTPTGFQFFTSMATSELPEYIAMIKSPQYSTRLVIEKIEHSPTCKCIPKDI